MYIVINKCYGGFGLSLGGLYTYCQKKYGSAYLYKYEESSKYYEKIKMNDKIFEKDSFQYPSDSVRYYVTKEDYGNKYKGEIDYITDYKMPRDDKDLVETVRELGCRSYGAHSKLEIVNIPDDVKGWEIDNYDGIETYRSW